ncbi:MAG: beta strand repeat-containing protein [Thiomonas sp.]
MNRKLAFQLSPVAAALAMALAAPLAQAAAPASGTLPGAFYTDTTGTTYSSASANSGIISVANSVGVLQWGGTSANVTTAIAAPAGITTAAGFNIGPNATLSVDTNAAGGAVLISDITTNASQIFGTLSAGANAPALFVANGNGVIVGSSATISAPSGLAILGYQPNQSDFSGTAAPGAVTIGGSTQTNNGAVTVQTGATINAGYMVVAGNGAVNVGATPAAAASTNGTYVAAGSAVNLSAGTVPAVGAGFNTAATVEFLATPTTLGITQLAAAGNVTVDGNSHVQLATPATLIGGNLLNHGDLILTSDVTGGLAAVSLTAQGQLASDGGIYYAGSTAGMTLASLKGDVLLGGVIRGGQNSAAVSASDVGIYAPNGSVIFDAALTTTTGNNSVNLFAANQIGVGVQSALMTSAGVNQGVGSIVTPTTATTTLVTANTVAKVNPALSSGLGVVIGNQGSIATGMLDVENATSFGNAGSSLFNGNVSAAAGFYYLGDSFYQGAGANISTPLASFTYGGDITGGVSAWTQSTDLYKNGVVFNAPAGGTIIDLTPVQLGANRQNTNLLVNGSASIGSTLPGVITPVLEGTSITVNNNFKPSNLFVRTAGGNLTLGANAGAGNFYWPGALYLSTVAPTKLAQMAPIVGGGAIGGVSTISNALPMNLGPGYGVFLMTNSAPGVTTLVTNPGSNVNVSTTGLPSFTNVVGTAGTATAYNATQTGNVLVFSNPVPAANVVDYTNNLPNE